MRPHIISCIAMQQQCLKIDFVYKQSKNYHPQVYVKEWKYTDA